MEQLKQNKEFIVRYFNAISGVPKTRALMDKFATDESLIHHIEFFEAAFPKYELFADEITAEGNRVVLRARFKGTHMGELSGIPPTHKTVEFQFAIGYEIENNKIISHWLIADQMGLMEQLGVLQGEAV
ncbi:ester cyclase [Segetibacter koreensis]|uniref:ester cyclase n=1 Tax=Segetibacter koreensis TaxID=398037 RepID=UPI00037E8C03|nr:ester cyclase [Segetibacter koreensis]